MATEKMEETYENIKKLREAQTIKTEVIQKTEKANSISYRYGNVGAEIKLYWKDEIDLMEQLTNLAEHGENIGNLLSHIKSKMGFDKTGAYR